MQQLTTPTIRQPHDQPGPAQKLAPEVAPPGRTLLADFDRRFEQARPRLQRLARALRIPPDDVDDIVQETWLRAWHGLVQLRTPERFDAWLDTICRNQCRMYLRSRRALPPFAKPAGDDRADSERDDALDAIADPRAPDPLAALESVEAALLLDRALGYLSPQARSILEAQYLRELSGGELAALLGVGTSVLEARLHRARSQLREVLEGPLRAESEALGLVGLRPRGWQPTRIWCFRCGSHRLLGAFERAAEGQPGGPIELRLRCPGCSSRSGSDILRSKGFAALDGLHSYRAAMTRSLRALSERTRQGLTTGQDVCLHCGGAVERRVATAGEFPADLPRSLAQHWVVAACNRPGCPGLGAWPAFAPAVWFHPAMQRFIAAHPRWMTPPDEAVEWSGRPAIRFRLAELAGSAELTLIADRATLEVLAAFP